jgi:hypothetical protein
MILSPSGRKYWFPGGTPELGMMLARSVLSPEQLDHPQTTIEFGERLDQTYATLQILKSPPQLPGPLSEQTGE